MGVGVPDTGLFLLMQTCSAAVLMESIPRDVPEGPKQPFPGWLWQNFIKYIMLTNWYGVIRKKCSGLERSAGTSKGKCPGHGMSLVTNGQLECLPWWLSHTGR